jgi:hypothetical protein
MTTPAPRVGESPRQARQHGVTLLGLELVQKQPKKGVLFFLGHIWGHDRNHTNTKSSNGA